jgi:hypothetical protein
MAKIDLVKVVGNVVEVAILMQPGVKVLNFDAFFNVLEKAGKVVVVS